MTATPFDGELLHPLRERLRIDGEIARYQSCRWSGRLGAYPALQLDDFTAIPFLDVPGAEEYQHRARLRAREGDLFAAVTPQSSGYEEYCRGRLGLGDADLIIAEPVCGPMDVALACLEEPAFSRLVDTARRGGGLAVHPYMGIEPVWQLAIRLREESGTPIEVLGPPPPVMWIANDKSLLTELVETLLGVEWLVDTVRQNDVSAMVRSLLTLAKQHDRVGLKRLRCASSNGNKVFNSADLLEQEPQTIGAEVAAFLEATEWDDEEEVLVVSWENNEISPSTQTWIPPLGQGNPRLDGIYEQILEGEHGMFVGSRPSRLPEAVNRTIGDAALAVARGLQELGYVGRCSFDHLVLGEPGGDLRIVFTECNGRWGGTSTPMSLVDRLVDGRERPPYQAQDFVHDGLVGASLPEVLEAVGQDLFDRSSHQGRFTFYNVGPLAAHGKLDVIAFGDSVDEAHEAIEVVLPSLLGLR